MEKIAFAGTFDPITNGHLWVIKEALNMAKEVIVMIAVNSTKNPMFDEHTRKEMIELAVKTLPQCERVTVKILKNEYVAQSALENFGCDYLIRGIRSALDFDYETLIQKTNTDILYGAKTLFVMPPRDLESVSSSFVKSLVGPVGWHWYIKQFIPSYVYQYWIEKYIKETALFFVKDEKVNLFIDAIKAYYNEPQRLYHNMDHLAHGLQEMQWLNVNTIQDENDMKMLCLAFLGHDVIYGQSDSTFSDEELSAKWTRDWLVKNKLLTKSQATTVSTLIEKTQYLSKKMVLKTNLEKQMCSIDLAILSKNKEIYSIYKENIRQEYKDIPLEQYQSGRLKALQKLLSIECLYESSDFSHYEKAARKNLSNEIELLKK